MASPQLSVSGAHASRVVHTGVTGHLMQARYIPASIPHINFFQHVTPPNLALTNIYHIQQAAQASYKHSYLVNSAGKKSIPMPYNPAGKAGQAGLTSSSTVPTNQSQAYQQISAVLTNDWTAWTGSSGGRLTVAELAKLMANSSITGSQAAVLAMIAQQMDSDISLNTRLNPSYTFAQVQGYVLGTSYFGNAIFGSDAWSFYQSMMSQIASAKNGNGTFNLYGSYSLPYLSTSGPSGASIQQQEVGDCFFMSAVESVLHQNPQLIANMITQNANGTFSVSFPNGPTQTINLTDTEIASFSTASNNGCWLAVLGMAENSVLVGLSSSSNRATRAQFSISRAQRELPLGVISDGGYPTQSLGLLTGTTYSSIVPGQKLYSVKSINALLTSDFSTNQPIGVDSSDHTLAIIGWNPTTQTVTLLNPWGITGGYGFYEDPGISNPNMQVHMTNGVFTLTTSQMLADFSEVDATQDLVNAQSTTHSLPALQPSLPSFTPIHPIMARMINAAASAPNTVSSTSAIKETSSQPLKNLPQASLTQGAPSSNFISSQINVNTNTLAASLPNSFAAPGTAQASRPVYEADEGSLLVMNNYPVEVRTKKGLVNVSARAACLIIQVDDECAVTNLCDNRPGDVTISLGGKKINVPMGKTLLLARAEIKDPGQIQLAQCLEGLPAQAQGQIAGSSVFVGNASYFWAMRNCPQFRALMHSKDAAERKTAERIAKAGAAILTLAQSRQ